MKHLTPHEVHQCLEQQPRALFVDVRMEIEYLYVGHPSGVVHVGCRGCSCRFLPTNDRAR